MQTVTIREYGAFCVGETNGGDKFGMKTLKSSTFELLEAFVLETNQDEKNDGLDIMGISARRGVKKVITAKNHVGVIALKDGTVIEILPKIYDETQDGTKSARQLLVKMLNTLNSGPPKKLQTANLAVERMNILEAFIRMFVDEVIRLTKRGLKSNYETLEDNLGCVKGKILFSEHIRRNFAHKERVYVAYDEFTVNRPENKLLKSTLSYLYSHTREPRNKKDIKNLLNTFSDVELSANYDADFERIVPDRNTKSYETALNWARVFLKKKSFTSFAGSTVSIALLFPMEKLFECYVPALMKRYLARENRNFTITTQDSRYYLTDEPRKRFRLRPDIVLTLDGATYIMDTKWKRLNADPHDNYGISQGDMYQMYAYYHRYKSKQSNVKGVTLIYPGTPNPQGDIYFNIDNTDEKIRIRFIDLKEDEDSVKEIISG